MQRCLFVLIALSVVVMVTWNSVANGQTTDTATPRVVAESVAQSEGNVELLDNPSNQQRSWKPARIEVPQAPSFIQSAQAAKAQNSQRRVGFIQAITKAFSSDGAINDAADASKLPSELKPNQLVFGAHSFPGGFPSDLQRRAVYGFRRRRMPYDVSSEFRSENPYRQVNNWRNSPDDVFSPRISPWATVIDPFSGDYARKFGYGGTYYGGYSSFNDLRAKEGAGSSGSMLRGSSHSGSESMAAHPFSRGPPMRPHFGGRGFVPFGYSSYRAASLRRDVADQIAPEFAVEYPEAFAPSEWSLRSPLNPLAFGPNPYIPGGDYEFHDFYAGSSSHSGSSTTEAHSSHSA